MYITAKREVEVDRSYSVARALALFNIDMGDARTFEIGADLPIEDPDWQVGVIVGPSGSGKSTLVSALLEHGFVDPTAEEWPHGTSILDAIGADDFTGVTSTLASVGLGSVPAWVRPFQVLSNGEQFRAGLARTLYRRPPLAIVDEFSSVVDRRVAQIGSMAFAKAWRRGPGQIVLVAPHFDILPWLKPDWVVRTSSTGPTVTAEDWENMQPEVVRDPTAPTVLEFTV